MYPPSNLYPPGTPPEKIPGTPEYAVREEAHRKRWEEELARDAELRRERQDSQQAARVAALEEEKTQTLAEIERRKQDFKVRLAAFGNMDEVYIAQAQLLHGMFTQAIDDYAASMDESKVKLFGGIALRAQNYCRMTLSAMQKMKQAALNATMTGKNCEIDDPAIKETQHETMDSGGTPQTGGTDQTVAAVENGGAQNA